MDQATYRLSTPYAIPSHVTSLDEDAIFYALRAQRRAGTMYRPTSPTFHAIDLACGTGAWAEEMAVTHPGAQIHGVGDPPPRRRRAANFYYHPGTAPFALPPSWAGRFDLVHISGIERWLPTTRWAGVIRAASALCRTTGRIEIDYIGQLTTATAGVASALSIYNAWEADYYATRGIHLDTPLTFSARVLAHHPHETHAEQLPIGWSVQGAARPGAVLLVTYFTYRLKQMRAAFKATLAPDWFDEELFRRVLRSLIYDFRVETVVLPVTTFLVTPW